MNMRLIVFAPLLAVLCIGNVVVYHYLVQAAHARFEVHFLDIGQGDSILLEAPGGVDVLIDGGPDASVLRRLPSQIGLFDHAIDAVIETHPDKDHISGLTDVFERYDVSYFLEPGVEHDSTAARELADAVHAEPSLTHILARRGMRLHLGKDAYADVLYPDRDVSHVETNDGSVTLHVVYGKTSFMLAGDAPSKIEDYVVSLDGSAIKSDVLKASHHGSRNSTDDLWLSTVDPRLVIYSAGKGNPYGHPSPEVVERVKRYGIPALSTIDEGTITLLSDGVHVWHK